MNKILSQCLFLVAITAYLYLSIKTPWVLGDIIKDTIKNVFLYTSIIFLFNFNLNIFLINKLDELEERVNTPVFIKTRLALKKSLFSSILIKASSFVIAIIYILLFDKTENQLSMVSFFNGFFLLVLFFIILIAIDNLQTLFKIQCYEDDKRFEDSK